MNFKDSKTSKIINLPLSEPIKLYVCGPTVYDQSHLGHARTYMTYDVIVRILRDYFGYEVEYAMNITDIDDKIITRSGTSSIEDMQRFTQHWEMSFFDDFETLHLQHPDRILHVTEYIEDIIKYIQQLIHKGFAYETSDGVYFDIQAYNKAGYSYFEFVDCHHVCDSQQPDFVLWKKSKSSNEPHWNSIWGPGRPGWHIECSVLSHIAFGDQITIHGGGVDLKFPHHNNELAQSRAYSGRIECVQLFLHVHHLGIQGQKMSKSLKNFVTIKEFLSDYDSDDLRWLFLSHPWDKPMDLDWKTKVVVNEARRKRLSVMHFLNILKNTFHHGPNPTTSTADELSEWEDILQKSKTEIDNHLRNQIYTLGVLQKILEIVHKTNKVLFEVSKEVLNRIYLFLTRNLSLLGFEIPQQNLDLVDISKNELLKALVETRHKVRQVLKSRNTSQTKIGEMWKLVDWMRDDLFWTWNVSVEDESPLTYVINPNKSS